LSTTNYADVDSASDVTSGNNGGLESNGSLATLIAQRNFKRTKTNEFNNNKNLQSKFLKNSYSQQKNADASLESYLPETGMYGNETAYISSPEDLVNITNAYEVFSLDMYNNDTRVSAVLATATENTVYDHSKVICDRLNSSSLEDIRAVHVRGHQIISSKIIRPTGEIENTLSFSIKLGEMQNELFSFWNIAQYPGGHYYNFQIWGSSFSQVFTIANHIIDTFTAGKPLISTTNTNVIPMVFVKSGSYSNGGLELDIINKINATSIEFNASTAETETTAHFSEFCNIGLSGDRDEHINIATGALFDIGFSIQVPGYSQQDALYLADGPWGIDYDEAYAEIYDFTVNNEPISYDDEYYEVERQPAVNGLVTGNVNLFRHVLPGEQTLDVTAYSGIQFNMLSDKPVEIILIPEQLEDWSNRLRFTIPATPLETFYSIPFDEFLDANGLSESIGDVKTIVFSVMGDYNTEVPFVIDVSQVAFNTSNSLNIERIDANKNVSMSAYPNPMTTITSIDFVLPQSEVMEFVVYDQTGKQVYQTTFNASAGINSISFDRNNLSSGLYFCRMFSDQYHFNSLKLTIN